MKKSLFWVIIVIIFSQSAYADVTIKTADFMRSLHREEETNSKPYLWVYWERINNAEIPSYISLCKDTLWKHCKDSFNIIELNDKNIYDFIPELKQTEVELKLNRLKIAHKVDYYRVMLLYKYGGIYLDSDIVVMRDLQEISDKLNSFDYVGFGAYDPATNDTSSPQNWVMVSRQNGKLITKILEEMVKILLTGKEFKWHTIGKSLIRSQLKSLQKDGYQYYQYSTHYDGTLDSRGKYITTKRRFSGEKITYKNIDQLLIVATFNTAIKKHFPNKLKQSKQEILSEDTDYAMLVRKSLGINA